VTAVGCSATWQTTIPAVAASLGTGALYRAKKAAGIVLPNPAKSGSIGADCVSG
jgi:hypothetical protein